MNPVVNASVLKLMLRDKIPMRCKLGPEDKICVEFADEMRRLTLEGKYKGVWVHVPNEGKRHPLVAIIMKAMGLVPGTSDYIFLWPNGGGLIEMKAGKNSQSPYQEHFQAWADLNGIPYAVHRSKENALRQLEIWGAIQ